MEEGLSKFLLNPCPPKNLPSPVLSPSILKSLEFPFIIIHLLPTDLRRWYLYPHIHLNIYILAFIILCFFSPFKIYY